MAEYILEQVRKRIQTEGLTIAEAAAEIGVGSSAIARHLSGEYVRSDSLAKYRLWVQGKSAARASPVKVVDEAPQSKAIEAPPPIAELDSESLVPDRPHYVVDLFCGCGGMSLGFERFMDGQVFRTAMALDIEEPMVRVFNDNHPSPSGELPISRQEDITDFMNEAEILAYYLDHLSRSTGDKKLAAELSRLGKYSLADLRSVLRQHDENFLNDLSVLRSESSYADAVRNVGAAALGQTSVAGFHNATKLPFTGTAYPRMGPLIWYGDGPVSSVDSLSAIPESDEKLLKDCRNRMRKLWDQEARKLKDRAGGSGHGQLASAAERINRFIELLNTKISQRVRDLWISWRSVREAYRITFFENNNVRSRLQEIYDDGKQVSVLLGGPPCQGFSRIGRGKIRSLREQSVHVHEDEDSVDSRNQLMHQYVLFVAALAPKVFLFENVRHFQAVVRSEGIEFDAADILAESIKEVSAQGLGYAVARQIVVASRHGVPQARERFVMAGVRRSTNNILSGSDAASWCLALNKREDVSLRVALEGLPEPVFANRSDGPICLPVEHRSLPKQQVNTSNAADLFRNWVHRGFTVDSHVARSPRRDDAAFFSLMGPGKRWMDYRCDDSPTLQRLTNVMKAIAAASIKDSKLVESAGIPTSEVATLSAMMDGSLSLRLLLETIAPEPGEVEHHLLTATYLRKKEGSHGDWLARMDPSQPSKTIVSHMAKDTYAYVHPFRPRTLSVREAARVQSFPDDYRFGSVGLVDGFKVVGNAVPPLLSMQFAEHVAQVLSLFA